jgi:hypothetical protein
MTRLSPPEQEAVRFLVNRLRALDKSVKKNMEFLLAVDESKLGYPNCMCLEGVIYSSFGGRLEKCKEGRCDSGEPWAASKYGPNRIHCLTREFYKDVNLPPGLPVSTISKVESYTGKYFVNPDDFIDNVVPWNMLHDETDLSFQGMADVIEMIFLKKEVQKCAEIPKNNLEWLRKYEPALFEMTRKFPGEDGVNFSLSKNSDSTVEWKLVLKCHNADGQHKENIIILKSDGTFESLVISEGV